ncbi:hypothetical protein [Streptomyces cavernae]|uniref:hypothetical protein n=1 Tax=Streptomyces cavernae TaxID=2259034 RepID=UPI000FEB6CCD|nr:hypothetical protein [Streptomyces cavernae]
MADNAFWIASLTAGTAVLASWVTSRGTARAARIQADTTASAGRVERQRETRRKAYADLIEQAQRMGDLYWKVSDLRDVTGHEAELKELRIRLRDEYGRLRHCVWIVSLEGPPATADAANTVRRSTSPLYKALGDMINGDPTATDRFDASYGPFWQTLKEFIARARETLETM